jgi:hypothetical protein
MVTEVTLSMPGPPAGPVPEDDLANELRFLLRDDLRDEAAQGEAKEIDLLEAQRTDKGHSVPRHRFNGVRCRAFRRADSSVVEDDNPVFRSNAIDDPVIPPVQFRG